jgi:uncharacterized protein (DUF2267 family)
LEVSQSWLKNLQEELHVDDERRAYHALRAVLHALRDRLLVEEAADLAAQMPMLIRGLYYDSWKPAATPRPQRSRDQFLEAVAEGLPESDLDAERAARAVFSLLQQRVTDGEIADVKAMLPDDLCSLWPEA